MAVAIHPALTASPASCGEVQEAMLCPFKCAACTLSGFHLVEERNPHCSGFGRHLQILWPEFIPIAFFPNFWGLIQ
jgi:hypothetical protein